ncbi:hypothetical protein [Ornithinibacillus bavariensis]|uniref:hypothetical protein n=1 Tax=Ornithinibacillus bavariensis TaxID=545502 RepID=UPI000ED50EFF|nr:hypothetical protein [Ornithinibacillus sp.]
MRNLVKYILHNYFRSNRYFPLLAIFIMMIFISYSYKPNPIVDSYSITALYLFFISALLCVSVFSTESSVQKDVTLIHTGSVPVYYLSKLLSVWLISFVLVLFAFLYPIIFGMFGESVTLQVGFFTFMNHLLLASLGICVGSFFTKDFMKSTINAIGGLWFVLLLSIPFDSLAEMLPVLVRPILWILPPSIHTIKSLESWNQTTVDFNFLLPFIWIIVYCSILLFLFFTLLKKIER